MVHILAERSHHQQKWHLGPLVLPAHHVPQQMHRTQHPHLGASHEVNQHNVLDIKGSYMELVAGSSQYCTWLESPKAALQAGSYCKLVAHTDVELWQHRIGNIIRITVNHPTSSPHSLTSE